MQRSFQLLDEVTDSVVIDALPDAQRTRLHLKLWHLGTAAEVQRHPQQVVEHNFERFAGPAGFGFHCRSDVVVQSQCSSHILMLSDRHQDVKLPPHLKLTHDDAKTLVTIMTRSGDPHRLPEQRRDVLRTYHQEMGAVIHAYGGTLERFTGDGMMVFFDAPLPVPDRHGANAAGPRIITEPRVSGAARLAVTGEG